MKESCFDKSKSEQIRTFRILFKKKRISDHAVDELWKWYDYSEKKGVASY